VPIYRLSDELIFPPASVAEPSGLLAIEGDLSPRRLLLAYSQGIFPWYSEGEPILWFSPDPRMVLEPDNLRISRGTRRTIDAGDFELRVDTAFEAVVSGCAEMPRPGQDGTWITAKMIQAYCRLHDLGFAHSVEAWREGRLVGGVYGVSIGSYFAAEAMFRRCSGASMAALIALIKHVGTWPGGLVDCQLYAPHLARLGAEQWPRRYFLETLVRVTEAETRLGRWSF